MRSPMSRCARGVAFCALLGFALACAGPPSVTDLSFVTPYEGVVEPEILQEDVEATWCFTRNLISVTITPPWRAPLADHGRAISLAIDRVPGANILTDISVWVRIEQYLLFQRVCAIVTGDAGYLK